MKEIKSLTGNEAVAYALKQIVPEVVACYPITPVTEIMQLIGKYIQKKEMRTEMILAESEHSAISACVGAASCNVRTATATASQGLLFMHEILPIASGLRLPIVMIVGNRAVSAPINIHNDHSDTMAVKDSGWLQFYAENPQEIYDLTLLAFKISEHEKVRLPIMICMDGFITTHELVKMQTINDEKVRQFIGQSKNRSSLFNFSVPKTIGHLALPNYYMDFRMKLNKTIKYSSKYITEIFQDFNQEFNKNYNLVETYNLDKSDTILIAMGSICGTIKEAIDQKIINDVGLLKIISFRPFPKKEIIEVLKNKKKIIVLDKSLTLSGQNSGHLYEEVRSALYGVNKKIDIFGKTVGLGGKPIYPDDLRKIIVHHE
jgi:pyruvate ferredoxin oxidoreductase alpha subunit